MAKILNFDQTSKFDDIVDTTNIILNKMLLDIFHYKNPIGGTFGAPLDIDKEDLVKRFKIDLDNLNKLITNLDSYQ